MNETRGKINHMVLMGLFSAIIVLLASVPMLGYIPLGLINATTIHLPVIIGACLLGPKSGAFLGGVFGMTSLVINTIRPTTLSAFIFSPFVEGGGFRSVIIAIVPRILIGVVAGCVFKWLMKTKIKRPIALSMAGFLGSITNTILVMSGIFLLYGQQYADMKGVAFGDLYKIIGGIIGTVGVPEAIVAAIVTVGVCIPLLRSVQKSS